MMGTLLKLLLILFLTPGLALAQTSDTITDEQAISFYNQCRADSGAMTAYSDAERQEFCTCVTVNMKQHLTVSDIRLMQDPKSSAGKLAMTKMLTRVHFPCAFPPIETAVRTECLTRTNQNPQYAAGGIQHCGCLAARMMEFVKTIGIRQAIDELNKTGVVGEPMEVLTQGDAYNRQLVKNYYTCFNGVLP